MISPATFRLDLRAFSDVVAYDDQSINFWIAVANLMLNVTVPTTAQLLASVPTPQGNSVLHFASVPGAVTAGMTLADLLSPLVVPAGSTVLSLTPTTVTFSSPGNVGAIGAGVAINDVIFFSGGPLFSPKWGTGAPVPVSPVTTLLDIAFELFVAHNLVLEKRAGDAAKVGGTPGEIKGPTASKSVGSVSISYDASAGLELEAGHWNLSMYGLRFIKLARMKGMGPVQIGIGPVPPYSIGSFGGAWPGPYSWPQQGDGSFGG